MQHGPNRCQIMMMKPGRCICNNVSSTSCRLQWGGNAKGKGPWDASSDGGSWPWDHFVGTSGHGEPHQGREFNLGERGGFCC